MRMNMLYMPRVFHPLNMHYFPSQGKYADKHSKKVTLLVCLSMCSIGYLFLGAVTNLFVIGIIRVYLGERTTPLI